MPTLTAAALVTSRITLGTFVASPNFRHPVSFARQLTALDDISSGRFMVGLGAGATGSSYDNNALGGPEVTPRQRVDRFAEFTEVLDLLLRTDHVTWTGRYYRAVDARNLPGCVQQPRVPFLMAANGPRSIALAARYGEGWVTTGRPSDNVPTWWRGVGAGLQRLDKALREVGRDPALVPKYLSLDASGDVRVVQCWLPRRRGRPSRRARLHRRRDALAPAGRALCRSRVGAGGCRCAAVARTG